MRNMWGYDKHVWNKILQLKEFLNIGTYHDRMTNKVTVIGEKCTESLHRTIYEITDKLQD